MLRKGKVRPRLNIKTERTGTCQLENGKSIAGMSETENQNNLNFTHKDWDERSEEGWR